MTAPTSIASCIAIAAFAAFAAAVPQTSADKYYFSVPRHPGGIKGVVMGDPPAYRVMRSEDIDWLAEAEEERNALRSGRELNFPSNRVAEFGQWPLSATNGAAGWTTALYRDSATDTVRTNIVARYTYSDNEFPNTLARIYRPPKVSLVPWSSADGKNSYRSGEGVELLQHRPAVFLDPDPEKWSTYTAVATNDTSVSFPAVTEVQTVTTTNWTGRYWDGVKWQVSVKTNVSYVTMALTNGTESVHTNMWTEILPHVETAVSTNFLRKSMLGMMFKSGLVELYDPVNDEPSGGPFRTSAVTANYGPLRGATVFAAECVNLTTNTITQIARSWSISTPPGDDYDDTTNTTYDTTSWPVKHMSATTETFKSLTIEYEYDAATDKWIETGERIDTYSNDSGDMTDESANSIIRRLMVWLPTDTVHVGGIDTRISHVEVYAWAEATWERDWRVRGLSADDRGEENKTAVVCRNIGRASAAGSIEFGNATNRYECFSATIPASLLDDAMSATGKSFPQSRPSVSLEHPCPEPDRDVRSTSSRATELWGAHITGILLIIHIAPWTSLPGW